jgi:hypothetical protein
MVKIIIEGSFAEFDTVPVYLLHQLQLFPLSYFANRPSPITLPKFKTMQVSLGHKIFGPVPLMTHQITRRVFHDSQSSDKKQDGGKSALGLSGFSAALENRTDQSPRIEPRRLRTQRAF